MQCRDEHHWYWYRHLDSTKKSLFVRRNDEFWRISLAVKKIILKSRCTIEHVMRLIHSLSLSIRSAFSLLHALTRKHMHTPSQCRPHNDINFIILYTYCFEIEFDTVMQSRVSHR